MHLGAPTVKPPKEVAQICICVGEGSDLVKVIPYDALG